jgi:hypothetical protein
MHRRRAGPGPRGRGASRRRRGGRGHGCALASSSRLPEDEGSGRRVTCGGAHRVDLRSEGQRRQALRRRGDAHLAGRLERRARAWARSGDSGGRTGRDEDGSVAGTRCSASQRPATRATRMRTVAPPGRLRAPYLKQSQPAHGPVLPMWLTIQAPRRGAPGCPPRPPGRCPWARGRWSRAARPRVWRRPRAPRRPAAPRPGAPSCPARETGVWVRQELRDGLAARRQPSYTAAATPALHDVAAWPSHAGKHCPWRSLALPFRTFRPDRMSCRLLSW